MLTQSRKSVEVPDLVYFTKSKIIDKGLFLFFFNRNSNIEFLLKHKEMLKANCEREEEKAAELELRSRLFSFGEFNSEAQVIILCLR